MNWSWRSLIFSNIVLPFSVAHPGWLELLHRCTPSQLVAEPTWFSIGQLAWLRFGRGRGQVLLPAAT